MSKKWSEPKGKKSIPKRMLFIPRTIKEGGSLLLTSDEHRKARRRYKNLYKK